MSTQQIFAALLLATATAAMAQTLPAPAKKPAVRRPSSTEAKSAPVAASAPAANPADNPPGVPPVTGAPRPLYALRYVDIAVGTGPAAVPEQYYTVRYTGWTTDGKKFDSSDDHPGKEPYTFPYGAHQVIPGWDTGFEGMHVGGKRRLYVPYQLAYGESGRPPVIPAKADLIFDLELVGMSDTPPAPPAPPPAEDAAPTGAPGSTAKPDTAVPPQSTPEDSHPNSPPKTQTTPQANPQTH